MGVKPGGGLPEAQDSAKSGAKLRRSATPVGVHNSPDAWGGPGRVGNPSMSFRVAGAGTGKRPCAVRTVPLP